jgi:surfeit locus 1 family protein
LKDHLPPQAFSLREVLTLRWILTSLLVILAALVMVRLGFWQLDRLQQRREHNARLSAGMAQPPLNMNQALPPDLSEMEYRSVVASGSYDFTQEILLRNQIQDGQPGYHLITPFQIAGTAQVVLVDRGWIPLDQGSPEKRKIFQEAGTVSLKGVLSRFQPEPNFLAGPDPQLAAGQTRLDAWSFLDLGRISPQFPYPLLPVYISLSPDASKTGLPQPALPDVDLSEGPHLGYAIQWFIFALILLAGYPFYVRKQLHHPNTKRQP